VSEQDLILKVAVLEERIANAKETLDKQAKEYERRLDELNHAHERSIEDKLEFLEKSVYEKSEDEHDQWRRAVATRLDVMAGKDATKAAMLALALAIIGVLASLVSLFLKLR
jgi:hypothetical protein